MTFLKKALPRRTLLRGVGASVALPLLDAMVPSMTALADTPASPDRLRRLGFVYMPMGCDHSRWTLKGDTLEELRQNVREAVECHFDDADGITVRIQEPSHV